MQIGAIGTQISYGYVYNTNTPSRASLNPVSEIPEDVLESKIDQTADMMLPEEDGNALKPGETRNFMDILTAQMEMGKNRASQILQTGSGSSTGNDTRNDTENQAGGQQAFSAYAMNYATQAYMSTMGIA